MSAVLPLANARTEIRAAIRFYSKRGSDWLDVVCYLSLKHTGRLDQWMRPYGNSRPYSYGKGIGKARPRGKRGASAPPATVSGKSERKGADTLGRGKPNTKSEGQR